MYGRDLCQAEKRGRRSTVARPIYVKQRLIAGLSKAAPMYIHAPTSKVQVVTMLKLLSSAEEGGRRNVPLPTNPRARQWKASLRDVRSFRIELITSRKNSSFCKTHQQCNSWLSAIIACISEFDQRLTFLAITCKLNCFQRLECRL